MMIRKAATAVFVLYGMTAFTASIAATTCEQLASLSLPNAKIDSAQAVAAGAYAPPAPAGEANDGAAARGGGRGGRGARFDDLPAFCKVTATLTPSADSDIKIEVWMPANGWNGNFLAAAGPGGANSALLGALEPASLAAPLRKGFATAATDTGHEGATLSFALGHPEKLIDYDYRAVHEMTVEAKAIIKAFYGHGPKLSYWSSCAAYGREGLKEAQRFPEDYDGIAVVAPAANWTHLQSWSMWIYQQTHKDEASFIPPAKFPALHQAVLDACDRLDGVIDGVIENPRRCKFDPATVQCQGADVPSCLTAAQVATARQIYAPATDPKTKKEIFPGLEPGSELGWAGLAAPPQPFFYATETFKYVVFNNANWDAGTFDVYRDVAAADKADKGNLNATDPDVGKYLARGGKLLLYTGWSDPLIPPGDLVSYYQSVAAKQGGAERLQQSVRLFMVPGMGHCGGGVGPNMFDAVDVVSQWRETGKAPERIVVSHQTNGVVDRTRPLCPFPQEATYTGSGSTDDAANFVCKAR